VVAVIDDRARVPFALVAVLLLVGSATLTATLQGRDAAPTDPATERAIERAVATADAELRAAATRAGRDAAADPVIAPANTTVGRVLNGTDPFRGAFRLRVYLVFRDALCRTAERVDGVRADACPPVPTDERELRHALDRVDIAPVGGNATRLRVRVANVTVTARRGGRVVERVPHTFSVVIDSPVLALHRRVTRFERRLDAGPTEPGLARRLTLRLHALAVARGYAQYGGAPIANVVANRHVGVLTNGALLDIQRSTLGHEDADARRSLAAATRRVGVTDLLVGAGAEPSWTNSVLDAADAARGNDTAGLVGARRSLPDSADTVDVRVDRSADRAFAATTDQRGGFDRILDGAESRVPAEVSDEELEALVYRDLVALRERVRNVSVPLSRRAVGSYRVNPPAELADRIRVRRDRFVDAVTGPPDARPVQRAAREAYLDAVVWDLRSRAADRRDRAARLNETLQDHDQMVSVYEVTGDYDIIAIGKFTDTDGMNEHIKELLVDPEIKESNTSVVLNAATEHEQFELDTE